MQIQNNILRSGSWRFQFIDDGNFGVHTKSLKSKTSNNTLDPASRLNIAVSYLFVESPNACFLVDLGIGNYPTNIFDRLNGSPYIPIKEKLHNFINTELVAILFSHLHIDHIGNYLEYKNTYFEQNFPDIPCFVSKKEWDFKTERLPKADEVYKNYYYALEKNIKYTKDGDQIFQGIEVLCIGGHTPGHQVFLFKTEENYICYPGDLIATENQLIKNRSLPYDFDPEESSKLRSELYRRGMNEDWIFALNHAPHVKFKLLEKTKKNE